MGNIRRTYKKVGDKIIVKNYVEDAVYHPKEVLEVIKMLENNIATEMGNINKIEENKKANNNSLKQIKQAITGYEDGIKEMGKFKLWAEKMQLSKLKNLVADVKLECENKVIAKYVYDKGLNNEQNCLSMFRQFQQVVATHPKINEAIARDLINDYCIIDSQLVNPWVMGVGDLLADKKPGTMK